MTTQADLYREYARVIEMCAGTAVKPWACVRYGLNLLDTFGGVVNFSGNPEDYIFALAIVKGRPVFAGDVLYTRVGMKFTVQYFRDARFVSSSAEDCDYVAHIDMCSWNPPKPKTFTLNGMELPLPDGMNGDTVFNITTNYVYKDFYWQNRDDRDKVVTALIAALSGKP